jgi:hypothetical protein
MRIERTDPRELAVHRRGTDMRHRGQQHHGLARSARQGKLQPGDELPTSSSLASPVQAPRAQELPVILEIVRVRLHRVQRPADVSEISRNRSTGTTETSLSPSTVHDRVSEPGSSPDARASSPP